LTLVEQHIVKALIKAQASQGDMKELKPAPVSKLNFQKDEYINHVNKMLSLKDGNMRMIRR